MDKPDIRKSVEDKQFRQKENHDLKARTRNFSIGDKVFVRNFCGGKPWFPGIIRRRAEPLSFVVGITNGQVFRHHLNHLRTRIAEVPLEEQDVDEWSYYEPGEQAPSGHPDLPEPTHQHPIRIRCQPDRYERS